MGILYHCLAAILFINRYIGGLILRMIRGGRWDEVDDAYEPTVSIIVPMFNEGAAITESLESLIALNYPNAKLQIVCVDDGSTDDSVAHAERVALQRPDLVTVHRNPQNIGKRMSIINSTRSARGEILVTVDSDVTVDRDALRQLVRRFTDERIAAVGGWVDVRNKHESWLTRMQVVKYWYSYFMVKNIEWGFRRVMCLSGCLTAYRRHILIEIEPQLVHRSILGLPISYGEDRFLTRQLIKAGYLTTMTLDAKCKTSVPVTLSTYFSQQLRWRRSTIVDYAGLVTHVLKLNPILAIHFMSLLALLFVYPAAIVISILHFKLLPTMVIHLWVLGGFGLFYRWKVRKRPPEERVGVLAILPLSVVMPLSYVLQTPLALFTLDSGSWETRNHGPSTTSESPAVEQQRKAS